MSCQTMLRSLVVNSKVPLLGDAGWADVTSLEEGYRQYWGYKYEIP